MAKKKDFLADFSFTKFENLSNGVEIPVSNSLKTPKELIQHEDDPSLKELGKHARKGEKEPNQTRSKSKSKTKVEIPALDYTNKSVRAMVNVVPTSITPKKKKEGIKVSDIDLIELGALTTKEQKVTYLAMRGWSLKVEQRRNRLYHYATKYIRRKKQRIYLGPVITET